MDELKLLIDLVAHLPAMAMWVLVGFYAYKVIVIGSIFGVLRFAIDRLYRWRTAPPPVKVVEYRLAGLVPLNDEVRAALEVQVARLASTGGYFHASDVAKLSRAIDAVLEERKS